MSVRDQAFGEGHRSFQQLGVLPNRIDPNPLRQAQPAPDALAARRLVLDPLLR